MYECIAFSCRFPLLNSAFLPQGRKISGTLVPEALSGNSVTLFNLPLLWALM